MTQCTQKTTKGHQCPNRATKTIVGGTVPVCGVHYAYAKSGTSLDKNCRILKEREDAFRQHGELDVDTVYIGADHKEYKVAKERDGRVFVWALRCHGGGNVWKLVSYHNRAHASMPQHKTEALSALRTAILKAA